MVQALSPSIESRVPAPGRPRPIRLVQVITAVAAQLRAVAGYAVRVPAGVLLERRRQRARVLAAAEQADAAERTQARIRLRCAHLG